MKQILRKFSITFCILLLVSSAGNGQVKIKEKISINPLLKNKRGITEESYLPISIIVGSPSQSFTFNVVCPDGSILSGEGGSDNPSVQITVPAINGTYNITVYVSVPAGGLSQANYVAWWDGPSLGYATHYISNSGNESDAIIPTTFSFGFNGIPELYDFTISFLDDEICGSGSSNLWTTYSGNINEVANLNLDISLSGDYTGAVIYDNTKHTSLGSFTTTTFAYANNLSVRIDSLYIGEGDKNIVVIGEAEGITRSDIFTLLSAKEYLEYKLEVWPYEPTIVKYGTREWLDAYAGRGGCGISYVDLADNIKYNVKITKGEQSGYLSYMPFGWEITERGTELNNLDHDYGSLYLWYNSFGEIPAVTDTVIINISTTDHEIEPKDITLLVEPNPLTVYTNPNPVYVGDTAQIIIKHFTESEGLVNFPPDQLFYVGIEDGYENGNIYSTATAQTSEYFWDTPGEFSFIAADSIDADSASVLLWVDTYIEGDDDNDSMLNISSSFDNSDNDSKPSRRALINELRIKAFEKNKRLDSENNKEASTVFENNNIKIKQRNKGSILPQTMSGSEYIYAIYEVMVCGNTQTDSVNHFKLSIIPDTLSVADTLAFGEGATIFIEAVDSLENTITLDETEVLKLKIADNSEYLKFIDETGDTLSAQIKEIEKPYSVFNKKKIKIAAIDRNPGTVVPCLLKVESIDDTSIKGENTAIVLEQTLKILMMGTHEVQPIITSERNDENSRAYMLNITGENRKEFSVALSRGSKITGGHSFKLITDYIDGSGGHDHISPRRPNSDEDANITERLKRQNYGSFYSYTSGPEFLVDSIHSSIVGITIPDTASRFEYIASIWGDEMKIYLTSLNNLFLKDSLSIIERIPNLVELDEGDNYNLIGGTTSHIGENNHYGSVNVIRDIVRIANDWHAAFPNELVLRINDISLPNGGKFDVDGSWRGPHQTHRDGEDIDIRTELHYYNSQGQVIHRDGGVTVRTPRTELFNLPYINNELQLNPNSSLIFNDEFQRICRNNNFRARVHNINTTIEHYHLDYQN